MFGGLSSKVESVDNMAGNRGPAEALEAPPGIISMQSRWLLRCSTERK